MAYYSRRYERFILATVQQEKDLGGLIKLMLGFFVSSLAARWMHQFQVLQNTFWQKVHPMFSDITKTGRHFWTTISMNVFMLIVQKIFYPYRESVIRITWLIFYLASHLQLAIRMGYQKRQGKEGPEVTEGCS